MRPLSGLIFSFQSVAPEHEPLWTMAVDFAATVPLVAPRAETARRLTRAIRRNMVHLLGSGASSGRAPRVPGGWPPSAARGIGRRSYDLAGSRAVGRGRPARGPASKDATTRA